MSKQVHKEKQTTKTAEPDKQDEAPADITNAELAEDTDDLLDEIDSVLEENAEEFVNGFIQKGGQ